MASRNIYCLECTDEFMGGCVPEGESDVEGAEPDEYTKQRVETGVLRIHCRCDLCNAPLDPGMPAAAVTLWRPEDEHTPPAWEREFLKPSN